MKSPAFGFARLKEIYILKFFMENDEWLVFEFENIALDLEWLP